MNETTKTAYAALSEEDQTFIQQFILALNDLQSRGANGEATRDQLVTALRMTDRFFNLPVSEAEAFIDSLKGVNC